MSMANAAETNYTLSKRNTNKQIFEIANWILYANDLLVILMDDIRMILPGALDSGYWINSGSLSSQPLSDLGSLFL